MDLGLDLGLTIVIIISLFVMLKIDADNLQLKVSLIFSDKLSNKQRVWPLSVIIASLSRARDGA